MFWNDGSAVLRMVTPRGSHPLSNIGPSRTYVVSSYKGSLDAERPVPRNPGRAWGRSENLRRPTQGHGSLLLDEI